MPVARSGEQCLVSLKTFPGCAIACKADKAYCVTCGLVVNFEQRCPAVNAPRCGLEPDAISLNSVAGALERQGRWVLWLYGFIHLYPMTSYRLSGSEIWPPRWVPPNCFLKPKNVEKDSWGPRRLMILSDVMLHLLPQCVMGEMGQVTTIGVAVDSSQRCGKMVEESKGTRCNQ